MPVKGNILYCSACDHAQSQINLLNCELCGNDLGAPNVNVVSTEDELKALQKRYDDAKDYLTIHGLNNILNSFESFFNNNAKAILHISLSVLNSWVTKTGVYASYHRALEQGWRSIAENIFDRKRTAVDSFLYGTHGRDMIFAAITLTEEGLSSYEDCGIILNEASIKARATTLEENSFKFVETHKVNFVNVDIPLGYRSRWDNKLQLAVAKVHKNFTAASTESDFSSFILKNSGDRDLDDFIEVFIFNELTFLAINKVFIPTPKNRKDKESVEEIEERIPGKVILV